MATFSFKALILFFLFFSIANASESIFTDSTFEYYIPILYVDGIPYTVKMGPGTSRYGELISKITEINELPPFATRFDTITNNMTRQEVLKVLGEPKRIYNFKRTGDQVCSAPELPVDSGYEEWEYGGNHYSSKPSGYAVWFASVDNSIVWKTVGTVNKFSCR